MLWVFCFSSVVLLFLLLFWHIYLLCFCHGKYSSYVDNSSTNNHVTCHSRCTFGFCFLNLHTPDVSDRLGEHSYELGIWVLLTMLAVHSHSFRKGALTQILKHWHHRWHVFHLLTKRTEWQQSALWIVWKLRVFKLECIVAHYHTQRNSVRLMLLLVIVYMHSQITHMRDDTPKWHCAYNSYL